MILNPSFNNDSIKGHFFCRQQSLDSIASYFDEPGRVITVNQAHCNHCIVVDEAIDYSNHIADAMTTQQSNFILTIKTADCVPILIADSTGLRIAAIHAGWRGAITGIIHNTIAELIGLGSNMANLQAAIGPCIQQASYEVDAGFYQTLIQQDTDNQQFFIPCATVNHWLFDLAQYARQQLESAGITDIEQFAVDTFSDDNYYSYRRDAQTLERQYSCIMLNSD